MYIFAADLSAAQRRSILGHKSFRDSDWSANNPQPSSEPIGESCTQRGLAAAFDLAAYDGYMMHE